MDITQLASDATPAATIMASALLAKEFKPYIVLGSDLLRSLLGKPFEIAGDMLADHVYFYRASAMLALAGKADLLLKKRGIKPGQLPIGFLAPFLNDASVAESDEIHSLFAKLFVSAVESDQFQHPIFRHIVSQMNADEARVLEYLAVAKGLRGVAVSIPPHKDHEWAVDLSVFKFSIERTDLYVENLIRLGVLQNPVFHLDHELPTRDGIPECIRNQPGIAKKMAVAEVVYYRGEIAMTEVGNRLAKIAAELNIPKTAEVNPPGQRQSAT